MYISGSLGEDFGGWVQNAVGSYGQYKAQSELTRFATKNGLSLQELNLILALNSKIGLEVAGTTYRADTGLMEGFTKRTGGPLSGAKGVLWDVNDWLLGTQGLLDAVALSAVNNLPNNGHLTGHSLGAMRVNNLLRQGYIQSGTLQSLPVVPWFNVAAAGSKGGCMQGDPICMGRLGAWFQPNTQLLCRGGGSIGNAHDRRLYVEQWHTRGQGCN